MEENIRIVNEKYDKQDQYYRQVITKELQSNSLSLDGKITKSTFEKTHQTVSMQPNEMLNNSNSRFKRNVKYLNN